MADFFYCQIFKNIYTCLVRVIKAVLTVFLDVRRVGIDQKKYLVFLCSIPGVHVCDSCV